MYAARVRQALRKWLGFLGSGHAAPVGGKEVGLKQGGS